MLLSVQGAALEPLLQPQLHYLTVAWPWASYLTSETWKHPHQNSDSKMPITPKIRATEWAAGRRILGLRGDVFQALSLDTQRTRHRGRASKGGRRGPETPGKPGEGGVKSQVQTVFQEWKSYSAVPALPTRGQVRGQRTGYRQAEVSVSDKNVSVQEQEEA